MLGASYICDHNNKLILTANTYEGNYTELFSGRKAYKHNYVVMIKLLFRLIKHDAMTMCRDTDEQLQTFLTLLSV